VIKIPVGLIAYLRPVSACGGNFQLVNVTFNYNGSWRIKTNDELDNLIKGRNIVNFTKAQRISWLGHILRMEAGRMVKRIYDWQSHAIRKRGRPKIRWKDDGREDLKDLGIYNWTTRTQKKKKKKKKKKTKKKKKPPPPPTTTTTTTTQLAGKV
jgi:hypothetical protein